MDVNPAWKNVLVSGINDTVGGHRQRRADRNDLLALDEDVARVLIAGCDDGPPLDQEGHENCSVRGRHLPNLNIRGLRVAGECT